MKEKKIVFIIPYFGKFNNYFQFFLQSCSKNNGCDWLIFTDDKRGFEYPQNVKVVYTDFEKIKESFQKKFDFTISLERPHKLCDYKVAYGYLFEDYLVGYDMWGYCDTDVIWGNISHFLSDDIVQQYDKIGVLGHCTLYKNSYEINRAFMRPLNNHERYKQVYSEEWDHCFDEEFRESINNIFVEAGYRIYENIPLANIYTKSSNFRLTNLVNRDKYIIEDKQKAFFLWDNGCLYRYKLINNNLHREEYMYIHMQARKMEVHIKYPSLQFKIIPNAFDNLECNSVDEANFSKVRLKYFNMHYFKLRLKNLMIKLKRNMLNC